MKLAFIVVLALCVRANGEVVFFDDFEQFTNGTDLTAVSYTPLSGPPGAVVTTFVDAGSPVITASDFLGSSRAVFDNFEVPNKNNYKGSLSTPLTNQVLEATWTLWIQSTNAGPGLFMLSIPTTNVSANYNPPIAFFDSGVVAALTNGPFPNLTNIGSWAGLAGSVMTNRFVANFPNRAFSFWLNGQRLATLSLGEYFTNRVDAIYFTAFERSPGSVGNRFALDDVKVETLPLAPVITSVNKLGTNLAITFDTLPGASYAVEIRDNLQSGSWSVLTNNLTGTGDPILVLDPVRTTTPKRFYHVVKTN